MDVTSFLLCFGIINFNVMFKRLNILYQLEFYFLKPNEFCLFKQENKIKRLIKIPQTMINNNIQLLKSTLRSTTSQLECET